MAVNDSLNLQDSCKPAPENCEEALSLLAFLEGQDFNLPLTTLCMSFLREVGAELRRAGKDVIGGGVIKGVKKNQFMECVFL